MFKAMLALSMLALTLSGCTALPFNDLTGETPTNHAFGIGAQPSPDIRFDGKCIPSDYPPNLVGHGAPRASFTSCILDAFYITNDGNDTTRNGHQITVGVNGEMTLTPYPGMSFQTLMRIDAYPRAQQGHNGAQRLCQDLPASIRPRNNIANCDEFLNPDGTMTFDMRKVIADYKGSRNLGELLKVDTEWKIVYIFGFDVWAAAEGWVLFADSSSAVSAPPTTPPTTPPSNPPVAPPVNPPAGAAPSIMDIALVGAYRQGNQLMHDIVEDGVIVGTLSVFDADADLSGIRFEVHDAASTGSVLTTYGVPHSLSQQRQTDIKMVVGCNRKQMTPELRKSLSTFMAHREIAVVYGIGSQFYIDVIVNDRAGRTSQAMRLDFNCLPKQSKPVLANGSPTIHSVSSQWIIPANGQANVTVNFSDPDGDIVRLEARDLNNVPFASFDPQLSGKTSGSFNFSQPCNGKVGRFAYQIVLVDKAGNTSAPYYFMFVCQ